MKICVWCLFIFFITAGSVNAQAIEAQQLLLNVEKLAQLKQMLADLKKGYEIVAKGYSTIKNISEGSFNLHQDFLDELLKVNPVIRNGKKVADIISLQLKIAGQCKEAAKRLNQPGGLTPGEITYLSKVYASLLNQSLKSLDQLLTVLSPGVLRMSDAERLETIDVIHKDMQGKLSFLRHFNNETSFLSLQRARAQSALQGTRQLYGVTQ